MQLGSRQFGWVLPHRCEPKHFAKGTGRTRRRGGIALNKIGQGLLLIRGERASVTQAARTIDMCFEIDPDPCYPWELRWPKIAGT